MGARVAVLPVQAVSLAVSTYLTIRTVGTTSFATVGLLIGLGSLFAFLNLGTSAAVSNAAGESRVIHDRRLFPVLVSATRATIVAGALTTAIALGVAFLGLWPRLLGAGNASLLTVGAVTVIASVCLLQPLGQGATILMATGRTVTATLAAAATSVTMLALVGAAAILHASAIFFVIAPFGAQLIVAAVTCVVAGNAINIQARDLLSATINPNYNGARIGHEARPTLVMWILLPLAYQTDRLLLNHLSTASQLASYNIASQFYMALFSIVAAGSAAMWGHFSHARASNELPDVPDFVRLTVGFAAFGTLLAVGYLLFTPWLSRLVSGGAISVSFWLALPFGILLIAQAAHQPSAMVQTDAPGLRFNACAVAVMTILNLTLGVLLTPALGAPGPVLASAISLPLALALPSFLRARHVLGHNGEALGLGIPLRRTAVRRG